MKLTKYAAVLRIAETGKFSTAAEMLHCTHSAISRMVKDVEERWAVTLFARTNTGVRLTEEGKFLIPYIRAVERATENLQGAISSISGLTTGTVRIGAFSSVATFLLPEVMGPFKARYPNVKYEILMGDYQEIEDWVMSGRVDFGFSTDGFSNGVLAAKIVEDELLLAANVNSPYAQQREVAIEQLEGVPFMLLEQRRSSEVTGLLKAHGVHPDIQLRTFEDNAVLNMIRKGLGVTIISKLISHEVDQVVYRPLSPRSYRNLYLIVRNGTPLSAVTEKFLETFSLSLKAELGQQNSKAVLNLVNILKGAN